MTEQELLEKIAKLLDVAGLYDTDISPKELATQILALIKEADYVRLAEDQSFGWDMTGQITSDSDCMRCFQARCNAGWRRVIL